MMSFMLTVLWWVLLSVKLLCAIPVCITAAGVYSLHNQSKHDLLIVEQNSIHNNIQIFNNC